MNRLSKTDILDMVPQQTPFRFIDQIHSLDEEQIEGSYTFKPTEFFYQGHFPGNPVTPGVILLETMAQTGVVAFGLYLSSLMMPSDELGKFTTLFSDVHGEFYKPVLPGDKVIIRAKKVFFRRMKLKVEASLHNPAGELLASATLSGMGVKLL
jgi:3-hydroxyacyl-[acyl-carrier-protein] dehydratase